MWLLIVAPGTRCVEILDSCAHSFCFHCIVQWSEVTSSCPMCKTTFKTLIHSVRANDDYKQVGVYCTTSMYHVLAAYSVLYCTGFEVLCTCTSDNIILHVLPVLCWSVWNSCHQPNSNTGLSGPCTGYAGIILVSLAFILVYPFLQYVVQPKTRADGQEVSLGEARR